MKFKKIMSLLLVLTLISSLLTTVTLLNPTAEATEATTPTTNSKTAALRVKAKSDASGGAAIYLKLMDGNIEVDKTYTVSVILNGTEVNSDNIQLAVKASGQTALALSKTDGELSTTYNGYQKWTVTIKPTSTNNLYIGIHFKKDYIGTADFYMGGITVIDESGNDISPKYNTTSAVYGANDHGSTRTISTVLGALDYFETKEVQEIDREMIYDPENKEAAKYLIHAQGKEAAGRAFYVMVPKDNVEAGENYTVSVTLQGITLNGSDRMLQVRNGTGDGELANSNGDTTAKLYSGAVKWTDTITIPETKNDLYIGIRLNRSGFQAADFYFGDVQLINKNGNNVAPALATATAIYGADSATNTIKPNEQSNWTELKPIRMDKADDSIKQTLFNTFYNGDSMLNLSVGSDNAQHTIYKRIPESELKGNTKYKISIKYTGVPSLNDYNNIVVRDNTVASSAVLTNKNDTVINHGSYYESVNYYTTPATPTDLYIGFYRNSEGWNSSELNIGDMQFLDVSGNNCFTSMSDMSDLYSGYKDGGIDKYTSENTYVKAEKQILDTEMFSDPVSTNRKMVNIKGLSNTDGARLYVKLSGVLPGIYQVSYKTKNFNYNITDRNFAVKTKASGTSDNVATVAGTSLPATLVSQPSLDEATYKFEATDFTDIYVGFDVAQSLVPDMDFIIENLELVRIADGKNLIDENLNLINWISFDADYTTESKLSIGESGSYQNSLYEITLMDYDESVLYPEQIVNIKGGKEPKYIIYIDGKDDGSGVAIFVKIPAANITAGETYTAKITVYGKPLKGTDSELLIRAGAAKDSTILARTGSGDNKGKVVTDTATNTVAWTVDVTPATATDLYIGIRLNKDNTQNADFYIGNVELIDTNGDNVAPELAANTDVYNAASATNTISEWDLDKLAGYLTTQEIVDIDNINNETIADIFAKYKPEDDDAGSEEKNYQLGKKAAGLEPGTYKITMVQFGADIKNSANPNFRVVLNGDVKYQTYDAETREPYVTDFGVNSYKFEATVEVTAANSNIQCEFIVGPYVMSNFNSYVKELSLVKVDDEGNESENLFTDLNVRDWRAANGELLTPDKYNSELQSIKNINLGVADANGNGKTDIADIRILSKMQDAGIKLTEGVNDVTTVRNAILNAAS